MSRVGSLRGRLVLAMVAVAAVSMLIGRVTTATTVDRTLDAFGRQDLQLSADHAAAVAADGYRRDGRWTARSVNAMARDEAVQGHTIVIDDGSGRPAPGSAAQQSSPRALAPVLVGGRRVGEVSLAHAGGGYLRLRETAAKSRFIEELHDRLKWRDMLGALGATLVSLAFALGLAVVMTGPLRRLTGAAERIEAGDLDVPVDVRGSPKELKQLGRTLERVSATLKQQEQVRRETVADLAHELRTPVAGLRGRIEAAQDGVLVDLPVQLEAMHADALRLVRLMEDFERLASAQQPGMLMTRDPVDLGTLARARGRAFEAFFEANGVGFTLDIEPAITVGDAVRLGQVVDNLLSNALRYTDRGGRVTLRVLQTPDASIIEVQDTGIGIAPEDLGRIFDRFWRSELSRRRVPGGSGIGLALVRELVSAHDGHVEVHSVPGRGARFHVHLPPGVREAPTVVRLQASPDVVGPDGAPVCVAGVTRDLGPEDWDVVERALLARIREGAGSMILDLGRVTRLAPRAASVLIAVDAQAKARGDRLVVICSDGDVLPQLERAGLTDVLAVVGSHTEAIEQVGRDGVHRAWAPRG
jgi:two-component system sensor histidine kinase BaeS